MYGLTPSEVRGSLGVTVPADNVNLGQAVGMELMLTFFLIMTIFGATDEKRNLQGYQVALSIGVAVFICLMTGVMYEYIILLVNSTVYYIDTSVLLENIPCVKSIRNYIRDPKWRIFHILTSEDIVGIISRFCTVVCAISHKTLVSNIIKRKLHGGLKIWILFSHGKNNILLTREAFVCKILFLPLENKIHIFTPPCNILYLFSPGLYY